MAGPVPAIHALLAGANRKDVDGRDEPAHMGAPTLMWSQIGAITVIGRQLAGRLHVFFAVAAGTRVRRRGVLRRQSSVFGYRYGCASPPRHVQARGREPI